METLQTFPTFLESVKKTKDMERATAEYFVAVSTWHDKITSDLTALAENPREIENFTPKMLLHMILGTQKHTLKTVIPEPQL